MVQTTTLVVIHRVHKTDLQDPEHARSQVRVAHCLRTGMLWAPILLPSLDLGLYSAGNYRTGHLPRRGLVDFTSSQISPITL